jgi:hypothetical protein
MSMSYNYPPQFAYPSAPPLYRGMPAPPRLHWGWVFGLSIVTLGLFGMFWMVVQAHWAKKIIRDSWPFGWSLAYLLSFPAFYLIAVAGGALLGVMHRTDLLGEFTAVLVPTFRLTRVILYIMAAFTLRGVLQAEPIDIPLSGVMTFLLAPIYFQYHLYDYSVEGKVAEQLSGFEDSATVAAAPASPQP